MNVLEDVFENINNLFAFSISLCRKLSYIPPNIDNLSKLLIFEFYERTDGINSNSKIIEIPTSFAKLDNLVKFDCNNNSITNIEPLTKLSNLRYLSLLFNLIEEIPSSIKNLSRLKLLDLAGNRIEIIPKELSSIKTLEYLDISHNKINKFPPELFSLPNLKTIIFLHNPFNNTKELKNLHIYGDISIDNEIPIFEILKFSFINSKPNNRSDNYNYFTLKIPKVLQTPMMQYITFFKDYVEATKGKDIVFEVKRDKKDLLLVTNGNTGITLSELGEYFQEYVTLIQQDLDKWIPNFDVPKTALEADIFRSKMERQIMNLRSDLDIARLESKYLIRELADRDSQIDFLKSLSKGLRQDIRFLVEGRTSKTLDVEQLLLDIIDQLIKMSERKYSRQLEDLHNDILTDFLRQKDYYATDQTRSGRSKLSVGELDIMIRKKNGTPFSIIEAFRLKSCGEENKTVAAHIDKLVHDYDTVGHERNFIIVYAEAKNFEQLWEKYQTYVSELNGKPNFRATYPLISFKEKKEISEKSSIKIGIAKHRREGKIVEIYHIFANMFV